MFLILGMVKYIMWTFWFLLQLSRTIKKAKGKKQKTDWKAKKESGWIWKLRHDYDQWMQTGRTDHYKWVSSLEQVHFIQI